MQRSLFVSHRGLISYSKESFIAPAAAAGHRDLLRVHQQADRSHQGPQVRAQAHRGVPPGRRDPLRVLRNTGVGTR